LGPDKNLIDPLLSLVQRVRAATTIHGSSPFSITWVSYETKNIVKESIITGLSKLFNWQLLTMVHRAGNGPSIKNRIPNIKESGILTHANYHPPKFYNKGFL